MIPWRVDKKNLLHVIGALLALVALAAVNTEYSSIGAVCIGIAIALFYIQWRTDSDTQSWLGNPVRILIPIITVGQLAYWIWFELLGSFRQDNEFTWMLPDFEEKNVADVCTVYLLSYLIYFIALNFIYKQYAPRFMIAVAERLNPKRLLIVAVFIISGSLLFTAADLRLWSDDQVGKVFAYFGTFVVRFYPLIIALLTYVIIREQGITIKKRFILLLFISLVISMIISLNTKMRFVVLEQILIAGFIVVSLSRLTNLAKLKLFIRIGIPIAFSLFMLLSIVKYDVADEFGDDFVSSGIVFGIDRAIQRVAQFTTDALVSDSTSMDNLFGNASIARFRLLEGLPFAGMFLDKPAGYDMPLEMEIYQTTSPFALLPEAQLQMTSIFIAGLSEIRFSFGVEIMIVAALFFGALHGFVSAYAWKFTGNLQWLIIVSTFLIPGLLGMDVSSLFRIPVKILLLTALVSWINTDSKNLI